MPLPANPNYFPPKISRYFDEMRYNANVDPATGLTRIYLGALSTEDADDVSNDTQMVNGSAVTVNFGATSGIVGGTTAPFGRNLRFVASSTNTRGVTITGVDYLGQPIQETLTLTSATAVYSKKAYWKVNRIVYASASDTTTVDVGYGNRFGVPFALIKGVAEIVDGVVTPFYQDPVTVGVEVNQTDLLAGTSHWAASPIRGYVSRLTTIVQSAVTTGGTLTMEIGGAAVTGLSNVIADAATAGTVVTDTPTDVYSSTGLVAANGALEFVGDAAFATAGVVRQIAEITPVGVIPRTNTQTATSYDPRGLFEPSTTPDSAKIFELLAVVDMNNTNGFLGYAHYNG